MLRVEIAGSPYELGLEYGRIVSENKINWWWTQPTETKLALVKGCEREIAVHAPAFLEEVRGIADACQSDYDLVLSNMTVTYWEQPGLRMNVVTRWVLDTFSDTPSAVDYLKRIPHHEGISYLVADKTGCIARAEAAPEGVDVAFAKDGMLAAINLLQSQEMAHLECAAGVENLVYRHKKRIPAWHDDHKGQIDLDAAKRLCSDHEIGLFDHRESRSEPFGTIYSWVAELGTGEIHIAHGRPCENECKVIELEVSPRYRNNSSVN